MVFYSSDIHGSDRCWMKFVNAAKFYGADALVMGGDLGGKAVVPIIQNGEGTFEMEFLGQKTVFGEDLLDEAKGQVAFNGFYPYVCDAGVVAGWSEQPFKLDEVFRQVIGDQVARWISIAAERLEGTGVQCYVMPGNDDEFFVDDVLDGGSYVVNPDMKVVSCGPFQMLSCSWVPPTPWDSPRECSENTLGEKLDELSAGLDPELETIVNLHTPPYQTGLDDAPELNDDLTLHRSASYGKLVPVGSHAVRAFIERTQPLVAMHGHIHESRGVAKIGRTICINPGSSYGDGSLDGCIITFRAGGLKATQLVRA